METWLDQLAPVPADAPDGHALARALEGRLHEERERAAARCGRRPGCWASTNGAVGTPWYYMISLARPLVEREAEGQRVRGVAGHAEELADGRDVPLAVRAVEALGDVEHEVGPEQREPRGEAVVGLEAVDLADGAERALHRIDGGGLVPLGVEIGLREIVAERATVGIVGRGGGVGSAPAGLAGASGLRLKASPIRTAKGTLYKKGRPRETSQDELGTSTKLK